MATITKDGATWTNTYNQDGMRIRRTNGTVTYGYVYNGSQLSQMTVGSNTLNFSYDANGIPMSVSYNGTTYYYATNLQGDVTAILNASGSPVVSYTYDAWGKPLTVTGSLATTLGTHNPLRYRGYVYDTETELYYLQSRYYNPDTGRFLNADAFTSTGQGFTGNNMFAYCGNNPIARKDDGGAFWFGLLATGTIVGGILGAVNAVCTGGNIWEGVIEGALTGLASTACGVLATTTAGAVVGGFLSGAFIDFVVQGTVQQFENHEYDFANMDYGRILTTGIQTGLGAAVPAVKSSTGSPLPSLKGQNADVLGTALVWSEASTVITCVGIGTTQLTKPKSPMSKTNAVSSSSGSNITLGNMRPSFRTAYVCI